jgi:quercetin dioxygenase-like cupin family protein
LAFYFFPKDFTAKPSPGVGVTKFKPLDDKVGFVFNHFEPYTKTPGQHKHDTGEQITVIIKGSGTFSLGDQVVILKPMDIMITPPGVLHGMEIGAEGCDVLEFESSSVKP